VGQPKGREIDLRQPAASNFAGDFLGRWGDSSRNSPQVYREECLDRLSGLRHELHGGEQSASPLHLNAGRLIERHQTKSIFCGEELSGWEGSSIKRATCFHLESAPLSLPATRSN
jgi:hypothetical protein